MSDRPGRNDPCPCCSGRKYKHCCGAASSSVEPPEDFTWRRMRRLLDGGGATVLRFVRSAYGEGAIEDAWKEFCVAGESGDGPVPGVDYRPMFMPWFFSFWSPDPRDEGTSVRDKSLHGVPPLRAYLRKHGARLDPALREYYESCLAEPLSFYRVDAVEPGKGMKLRDIVVGGERTVAERLASQSLRPGDIVCAQAVRVGDLWLLECTSPFCLPPIDEIAIADYFRDIIGRRKKGAFPLREFDLEVLLVFHELAAPLFDRETPKLQNMDGDALSMRKVVFDIESAEATFTALRKLDPGDDAELAPDQQRDAEGRLQAARLTWVVQTKKPRGEPIVHGTLEIQPTRLVAQVNSAAREASLRKIVDEALGNTARYRATEIQSVESLMAHAQAREPKASEPKLRDSPEVQVILKEHMTRYYEQWLHERIPALGERTPLQAARSKSGRQAVSALVRHLEREGALAQPPLDPEIIARLRQRLGIAGDE